MSRAAVLRRTLFARRWRQGAAGAEFLDEENLCEPEAAPGEFAGVVVGEKLDAFLAHFSEIDVPGEFAKVVHRHAGAVLGLAAGLLLLTTAGVFVAAFLLFHTPLLFLLAALVFLFPPLLILLAALLLGCLAALRIAGLVRSLLVVLGRGRRGGGAGRFISGVR